MIRTKDIAEMVGVSRQAVTSVLNNTRPGCVSKEKREAIIKIASQYNYRPNHAARSLKTGKSNIIGVVMPPWNNPYVADLCMAIQKALAEKCYTPFFTIDNNFNPVPGNLEQLLALNVAGIITVASSLLPDNIDTPVVSYFHDDPRFDSVCTNAELKTHMICEYLKKNGHQKIGYLGLKNDSSAKLLNKVTSQYNLEFHERWNVNCVYSSNQDAFSQLLEQNQNQDLPTALIVHNDALEIKVMRSIYEHNYQIPKDFSIIGQDNLSYAQNAIPSLTSTSFGTPEEIANTMVELLISRIKDKSSPRKKIVLNPQLFERESVLILTPKF